MSATKRKPDNMYQRNGVWWIRYNVSGRKVRSSLGTKSERKAKRLRDEILGKRSAAAKFGLEAPEPKREHTFAEIAELFLQAREASGEFRQGSIAQAEHITRTWLVPAFGHRRMSEITIEHIEQFLAHLRNAKSKRTGRKLSRATIAAIFAKLRALYRQAIRRGWYTGPNPLDRLDRAPTEGPGRDVTLTTEEAERLLDRLSGPLHYKVALALATGLRWGEVHGLAWEDVQLDGDPPTLTVRRSWRREPKTESSAATLPISRDAVALLRRWQMEQGPGVRYVFPGAHGEIPKGKAGSDARRIHKAAEKASIGKLITPHVFRHTFGTWVYERTGDPKMVQRLMRHGSFATSMRYVHDRRDLSEVVNKLPQLTGRHLRAV